MNTITNIAAHDSCDVQRAVVDLAGRGTVTPSDIREAVRKMRLPVRATRTFTAAVRRVMREIASGMTQEQREALSPETMRQQGQLARLLNDLAKLPDPVDYAKLHGRRMYAGFPDEAEAALRWVRAFVLQLRQETKGTLA